MQVEESVLRTQLPIIRSKPQSVSNVFTLIRMKKQELTKKIESFDKLYDEHANESHQNRPNQEDQNLMEESVDSNTKFLGKNNYNEQDHGANIYQSRAETQDQGARKYLGTVENQPKFQAYRSVGVEHASKQYQLANIFGKLEREKFHKKIQTQESEKFNRLNSVSTHSKTGGTYQHRTRTQLNELQGQKLTNSSHIALSNVKINKNADQNLKSMKSAKQKFKEEIEKVPKSMKARNQENLSQVLKLLETFNPFFNRIQRVISVCLVKMSRFIVKEPHLNLYKANQEITHFYIILLGKVRLTDSNNMKRLCQTGQTLLQEILFTDKGKKVSLQRGKTVTTCYLLQIRLQQYKKIKEELIRYGYKQGLREMQAVIKRNYIIKNWMRNKNKLESYK